VTTSLAIDIAPTSDWRYARCRETPVNYVVKPDSGRDGRIRTDGPLLPGYRALSGLRTPVHAGDG
jgi:hypothetical protein